MIGSLMMCVSVVILLFGMVAGIAMGIEQDFTLAPAHAHLNLVGGVLLFVFGLYYKLVPAAGKSSLAKLQGWLQIAGGILFPQRCRCDPQGNGVHHRAGSGIPDRRRCDGAIRLHRVQDVAGLTPHHVVGLTFKGGPSHCGHFLSSPVA